MAPKNVTDDDALSALDLRLRFLEMLLAGSSEETSRVNAAFASLGSVGARAVALAQQLEYAVKGRGGEAMRRFVEAYDQNVPLLSLPMPLPTDARSEFIPSSAQKTALVLEGERDIRTIECDLRELKTLDDRDAAGAGKLGLCEGYASDLKLLRPPMPVHKAQVLSLEHQTSALLSRYDAYVDTLSELFVSWDGILTAAETEVTRLEKKKVEVDEL